MEVFRSRKSPAASDEQERFLILCLPPILRSEYVLIKRTYVSYGTKLCAFFKGLLSEHLQPLQHSVFFH
jgi:hypothetical protein